MGMWRLFSVFLLLTLISEPAFAKRRYVRNARRARGSVCSSAVRCIGQTNELLCMACTIHGEARGEPVAGQIEVGRVVLTRMTHEGYPKSICGVVHARYQFQGASGANGYMCGNASLNAARRAIQLGPDGLTHFHATYVNPRWGLRRVARVGSHIFFRDRSRVSSTGLQKLAALQRLFGGTQVATNQSSDTAN